MRNSSRYDFSQADLCCRKIANQRLSAQRLALLTSQAMVSQRMDK